MIIRYILATSHISIILVRIINAFIDNGGQPLGATLYLANIAEPINRSKDMIYISMVKDFFAKGYTVANLKLPDCSWRLHISLALLHGLEPKFLCDRLPLLDDTRHCEYVIDRRSLVADLIMIYSQRLWLGRSMVFNKS